MTGKMAFVFPGQGAQFVGMGKDICQIYPEARAVFKRADETLGYKLSSLCFEGPDDALMETENTQPAILATSLALYSLLELRGYKPDAVAGLSLGEYSGLVASGVLSFEDALPLVQKRGRYMQETVPLGEGAMAAVIGLEREVVNQVCRQAADRGVVEPANFNCPGQIVIAGQVQAVRRAIELAEEAGAKRVVLLPVSAPFHCSLLLPAADRLARDLEVVPLSSPSTPVVANVSADYVTSPPEIVEALTRQVASPVLWEESIRRLWDDGVRIFLEIGPGTTLSGFIRRTCREAMVLNIGDLPSLQRSLRFLEGEGLTGTLASGR